MALLYRAIWNDRRPDLVDAAGPIFQRWVKSKRLRLTVPDEGTVTEGGVAVTVDRAEDEQSCIARIRLVEERPVPGGEERWTTTAHWLHDGASGWVWVDLEWVSDDTFARTPDVAAPRLAHLMLSAPGAELDGAKLGPSPIRVAVAEVDDLVDHVFDRGRTVPVVVFSTDTTIGPEGYAARVRESARRLTGVADVRMLTSDSEVPFESKMRPLSLSVFGGAARVYLPGIDADDPQPWRHRYVRAQLLSDRPHVAAGRVGALVLQKMVAQRPPEVYRRHFKQLLDSHGEGTSAKVETRVRELDDEVTRLQVQLRELNDDRDWAVLEAAESERLAEERLRRLDAVRAELRVKGGVPEVVEQGVDHADDIDSCADAVVLGSDLQSLVIHPDAPRDIDRMDEQPDAELWGRRIWAHLQALDAYAADKGSGFQQWCEHSGHPRAISLKFVSMTESESVRNNERFRRCRDLPVAKEVHSSGVVEMLAHIKSVQGGGMQIPRIYFHDDTKGRTGKVHVGFIGPHDLMPNTRTN